MIIINLIGISVIALIVWWFWLYKPREVSAEDGNLTITVENGIYSPSHIKLEKHMPTALTFLRKDASPCAELLLIPGLKISETLILNSPVIINLPGLSKGNYPFHCQMQMYKGEISVI